MALAAVMLGSAPRAPAGTAIGDAVSAQVAPATHDAQPAAPSVFTIRPRVALVLSGGGARGLAHIGVLKVLRELNVPVDVIVGTSMGSIVGGAYAAGHTPEQMETLVGGVDWNQMFTDRAPREYLTFRRKEDDLRFIGKSELGLKDGGVLFPRGAFGAQSLEEFLRLVAKPASDSRQLDALPIPLRAVATDLVTGRMIVLSDVPLSQAMRASMSVPGAFAPTTVDGRLLGDGGLTRNLPVEVARDLAPDVIIAVNVGTPLLPRESLSSAFGVAQQMVNILTEQNVATSIAALNAHDILISPDLAGFTFVDFDRGAELIARGEAAARAAAPQLRALAADSAWYAAWEAGRARAPAPSMAPVDAIVTRGATRTNPVALLREIEGRTGVAVGARVDDAQLTEASRVLYGMGEFERVQVTSETNDDGRRIVVVDVDEKPWGPDYLRFGGRAIADLGTQSSFSVTLQHTRTWLNAWGAEWRNEAQLGDVRRFMTSLYHPLGPASPFFVEPVLETVSSDIDLFEFGDRRTDRLTHGRTSAYALAGMRLGTSGVVRVGGGREWYRTTPTISSRIQETLTDRADFVRTIVRFDTLDDANFPRHGYAIDAAVGATRFERGNETVQSAVVSSLVPYTVGRLTLTALANAGWSRDGRGSFALGGLFNLSGTPFGAVNGGHLLGFSGLAYYRLGDLPRALGGGFYGGMSLEAGNTWAKASDMRLSDLRKAASVFVGMDSIIGPLYLGYGHTFGGSSALYLFLGRPTAGQN